MLIETIYNETAKRARQDKFDNVKSLGPNEPFSKICTHCVLIGYSMTRRMTAAFSPQDEPDVLCKIQYGILTAPKSLVIDAVNNLINRPSQSSQVTFRRLLHRCCDESRDFGNLQEYRAMEDEMSKKQRSLPSYTASSYRVSMYTCARWKKKPKIFQERFAWGLECDWTQASERATHRRSRSYSVPSSRKEWLRVYSICPVDTTWNLL